MVDGVDQHREAKDIGEKDEFLPGDVSPASHNLRKKKDTLLRLNYVSLKAA